MPKKSNVDETLAREVAAPIALRLLSAFTDEQIEKSIQEDLRLMDLINLNPGSLRKLRFILLRFPFYDRALERIKTKKWIDWFIDNEIKHERPGFYAVLERNQNSREWVYRQIEEIVEALE